MKKQTALQTEIVKYARELRTGQGKLAKFAEVVLNTPTEKERKILPTSKEIREVVLSQKGEFTSKAVADKLGVTPIQVNNNLYSLQRSKAVDVVGKLPNPTGRGQPVTVWSVL